MLIRAGAVGKVGQTSGKRATSPSAAYDIILMPTDSFGVGVYAREVQDTDWTDVYQYRSTSPVGINADTTPLDQAIAPDGTSYLSILEYIGKTYQQRTGRKVLLVPHSYNGTNLISSGHSWQVGDTLHEGAITRTNAAIAAAVAQYPGSAIKAIVMWESGLANDASSYVSQSLTKAAAKTALSAAITHFRSAITGATNVPIILGPLTPDQTAAQNQVGNPGCQVFNDALAEVARDTTGVFFVSVPAGYSADNLHLTNAGTRLVGPMFDAILADTTAPVIGTAGTLTVADAGPIGITLTADEYVTWSVSGGADAAAFEINRTFGTGGAGNINSTIATYTLRLVGNANVSYATKSSYAVTVQARDGAGNSSTKSIAITVAQPYGVGDQGPTTMTHSFAIDQTGLGYLPSPHTIGSISYGAGLVLIFIRANGVMTSITGVSLDGSPAAQFSHESTGDPVQTWGVVKGAAGTGGTLTITYAGSRDQVSVQIVTMSGTKATPFGNATLDYGYRAGPVQNASSATCPTNGIIVGLGQADATITGPVTGSTRADPGAGKTFAVYRKTSGYVGVDTSSGNYCGTSTLIFEKSV